MLRSRHGRGPAGAAPRLVVAVVAVFAVFLAGCGDSEPLAADVPESSTTTTRSATTSAEPDAEAPVTEVATANGASVEVFTTIPEPEIAATAPASPTPPLATNAAVLPIPREGYGSAGVQPIDGGMVFDNPTYFGNPLVFVVTAQHEDWLRVLVPARPNGQQGWVRASDVTRSTHTFRVELDLSDFQLRAYDGTEVFAETAVVIGKATTPTPTGTFFITEALPRGNGNPGGAYGAWILPTNGYSETMNEFDGGLPVIALHGTNNPGAVGTAVSNGCVRMPDEVVIQLAERLPAGTPVTVVD